MDFDHLSVIDIDRFKKMGGIMGNFFGKLVSVKRNNLVVFLN